MGYSCYNIYYYWTLNMYNVYWLLIFYFAFVEFRWAIVYLAQMKPLIVPILNDSEWSLFWELLLIVVLRILIIMGFAADQPRYFLFFRFHVSILHFLLESVQFIIWRWPSIGFCIFVFPECFNYFPSYFWEDPTVLYSYLL